MRFIHYIYTLILWKIKSAVIQFVSNNGRATMRHILAVNRLSGDYEH